MIQKLAQKFDKTMQEKFDGQWGEAAYNEALTIAVMYFAHDSLLHAAPREHHPHINAAWYGSWNRAHPLHPLRTLVQDKIAAYGSATFDPEHNVLHREFANLGEWAHKKVRGWAQERNHHHQAPAKVKDEWVYQKANEMDSYMKAFYEPQKSPPPSRR